MTTKTDNDILEKIKSTSSHLVIELDVQVHQPDQITITFSQDITRSHTTKQGNHIIPAALFLAGLQANIERQSCIRDIFNNLESIYNFDDTDYNLKPDQRTRDHSIKPSKFQVLKRYFDDEVITLQNNHNTAQKHQELQLKDTLAKYIIPLIYSTWNSRENAIYKKIKEYRTYGIEGTQIKRLKTIFKTLYKNGDKVTSWNQLQLEIQKYIELFIENIDIPPSLDNPTQFFDIIQDVKLYIGISVYTILSSKEYSFVCSHDNHIDPNIEEWYNRTFELETFGQEFIKKQDLKERESNSLLLQWSEYIKQHTNLEEALSDLDSDTSSDYQTPKNAEIHYTSQNIERIFANTIGIKTQVLYNPQSSPQDTDTQLIQYMQDYMTRQAGQEKDRVAQHYLVINVLDTIPGQYNAYLAKLQYRQKYTMWQLYLVPIAIKYDELNSKMIYIRTKLQDIKLEILDAPKFINKDINDATLEHIIEYTKLRLTEQYKIINANNVNSYNTDVTLVQSIDSSQYKISHANEAQHSIQSMMLHTSSSQSGVDASSDSEYHPESLSSYSPAQSVKTIESASPVRLSHNIRTPKRKIVVQYDTDDDIVSEQNGKENSDTQYTAPPPKRSKTCLFPDRQKREVSICTFDWEDVDKFNVAEQRDIRNINKIKIDSTAFLNQIQNTENSDKRTQLIQFCDEFITDRSNHESRLVGNSQRLVFNLINKHRVISHLEKVEKISTGIMAKSVLADFVHHDYEGVAINIGFITGDLALNQLSNVVSIKGTRLVLDGQILFAKALKSASPFIARGTSTFIIYDLVNQIRALQDGNQDALIGIVADGTVIAIDVGEIAIELAEILGPLSGVSAITGPVGSAIGTIVFVGTDVYLTIRTVNRIDHVLHLTSWEKLTVGFDNFIGLGTPHRLEKEYLEKCINNQLVNQSMPLVKAHPEIQHYIFGAKKPLCKLIGVHAPVYQDPQMSAYGMTGYDYTMESCNTTAFEDAQNHTVLLNNKRHDIKWSRTKPDKPNGGEILCYPKGDDEQVLSDGAYQCDNAIGISDSVLKANGCAVIDLGGGNDEVIGLSDTPNIFIMRNGHKKIIGGLKNDMFIVIGNSTTGIIDGGIFGNNTIDLSNYFDANTPIYIKHLDSKGSIHTNARNEEVASITFNHINRIIGRKNAKNIIQCDCSVVYLKSQGGGQAIEDQDIIIIQQNKKYLCNMTIAVTGNTLINNTAQDGTFVYDATDTNDQLTIDLNHSNATHILDLNQTLWSIEQMNIERRDWSITFMHPQQHDTNLTVNIQNPGNNVWCYLNPKTSIYLSSNNTYIQHYANESIDDILLNYPTLAAKFNTFIVVTSLVNNATISIGHDGHEVIYNDPLHESHLVGGRGDNIYVITLGDKRINSTNYNVEVPTTTIYHVISNDVRHKPWGEDTLDLRPLSKEIGRELECHLVEHIDDSTNIVDIVLDIKANNGKNNITKIILKHALHNYWYDKLQVILHNAPMKIGYINHQLLLIPKSMVFNNNIDFIAIQPSDVDHNAKLEILSKPMEKYDFFYVRNAQGIKHQLILTNVLTSIIEKENWCTILFNNFFEKIDKMSSMHLQFSDRNITLRDEIVRINNATDFYTHKSNVMNDPIKDIDSEIHNKHRHHHGDTHRNHRDRRDIEDDNRDKDSYEDYRLVSQDKISHSDTDNTIMQVQNTTATVQTIDLNNDHITIEDNHQYFLGSQNNVVSSAASRAATPFDNIIIWSTNILNQIFRFVYSINDKEKIESLDINLDYNLPENILNNHTNLITNNRTTNQYENFGSIDYASSSNNSTNIQVVNTLMNNGTLMLGHVISHWYFGKNQLLQTSAYISPTQEQHVSKTQLAAEVLPLLQSSDHTNTMDSFVNIYNNETCSWYDNL